MVQLLVVAAGSPEHVDAGFGRPGPDLGLYRRDVVGNDGNGGERMTGRQQASEQDPNTAKASLLRQRTLSRWDG
jgi:hypothetical protein